MVLSVDGWYCVCSYMCGLGYIRTYVRTYHVSLLISQHYWSPRYVGTHSQSHNTIGHTLLGFATYVRRYVTFVRVSHCSILSFVCS